MIKDPRVYLAQILECITRIVTYTAGGKQRFLNDPLVQDAVIRNFEIIGEAAKRIPKSPGGAWPPSAMCSSTSTKG